MLFRLTINDKFIDYRSLCLKSRILTDAANQIFGQLEKRDPKFVKPFHFDWNMYRHSTNPITLSWYEGIRKYVLTEMPSVIRSKNIKSAQLLTNNFSTTDYNISDGQATYSTSVTNNIQWF